MTQNSKPPYTDVYRRLLRYLVPHKKKFFLALGAMIVYGATDGVVPYLLKRILDDVFGSRDQGMLYNLVLIIVGFSIIRGVFGFCQKYLAAQVGLGIVQDLRNEINRKLLYLSPAFYQTQTTGGLIARVTNDTLLVRTALTDAAAVVLRDSVRVITLLIVAFSLDPVLALIALVGLPVGFAPIIKFGKKIRRLSRAGQDYFGGLTAYLQETITGHRVVQAFSREEHEHQRFKFENEKFTNAFKKAEKYGALSGPTNEVVASLAIAAVLLYGGHSVITGARTQGDFIAFLTTMFLLYEPVKKLSRINATVQTGVSAAERIFEIIDEESDIEESLDPKHLDSRNLNIAFENVSFSYDSSHSNLVPSGKWALQNVSAQIEAGSTVALVGMSGGGKSTFVNLLPRFYDPQEGSIKLNGVDIKEYSLKSLRDSISMVSQHTFLFNTSVSDNIAYGNPSASADEVISAAKIANAHEFIENLPEGYNTILGEQGMSLSGGQRARIAIARAILRDSPILVFDEATASLDSESEDLVQDAIQRLVSGRTVLVIAHRLATVRSADSIIVLSNGRLVEKGTHDELLDQGGEYSRLYRLQFKDAEYSQQAVHS
jgi:subfamily B ATP-binding cassette protein MsbA